MPEAKRIGSKTKAATASASRRKPADTSASTTREPRRIALLIGNANVSDADGNHCLNIPGIDKDLSSLGGILRDPEFAGFEVRSLLGPTLIEVRREIERLALESGSQDVLLLYYSGTSLANEDEPLYMPVSDSDPRYLQATCLDSDFVLSSLRRSKCRQQLLLIDGCHAGAFFTRNRGIPDGFCAITACGVTDTCYGNEDGGFFTRLIVEGLRGAAADADGDGTVDTGELFRYVRERSQTLSQPIPQFWSWNLPVPIPLVRVRQRLFLSYARKDQKVADLIATRLESAGYGVWLDRADIAGATRWRTEIEQGLEQCEALLLLISKSSLASDEVYKELAMAIEAGKTILPLRLDQTPLQGWYKDKLGGIQHVDYQAQDAWWKKLLAALKRARLKKLQAELSAKVSGSAR